MSVDSSVIDKLAKMLRHKESAERIGSIAEAEAFAARIQEWLTKHKLEMSDIQFIEQGEAEPIEHEHVSPTDLGIKYEHKRIEWQEDLAMAIAHSNDCRTLISNHSNAAFFVGRKTDREVCVALLRYFVNLISESAEKAATAARDTEREKLKAQLYWYSGADLRWHMRDFRVSYCAGMSQAIQGRLLQRRRQLEKELKAKDAESTALIHLRSTAEKISEYMNAERFNRASRAKPNIDDKVKHRGAYKSGQQIGEQVALTSGALK